MRGKTEINRKWGYERERKIWTNIKREREREK